MSRDARWNRLLELLAERGRLEVEETAAALDVSPATIRRDLDRLARQRMLLRTRGGAAALGVSYELPLRYKRGRQAEEKQRIGRAVAGEIAAGEVVGLTGGTTVTEVARALSLRPDITGDPDAGDKGRPPALTVVTNALNIANELAVRPQIKIVVTGGVARSQSYELTGPLAGGVLDEIALDTAVLGVNAIDGRGAHVHHEGEASINRLLAERARRVIVAADSSKTGRRAFARICGLPQVDVLVTDAGLGEEARAGFRDAGVRVVAV